MNKAELQSEIMSILSMQPTDSQQNADQIKRQIAENLASTIDRYVQAQIGQRLALITTSITCPAPAGVPTPTATYSQFIKVS